VPVFCAAIIITIKKGVRPSRKIHCKPLRYNRQTQASAEYDAKTLLLTEEGVVVDVQTLTIVKAGGPLGLSIVGGQGHTSHPFGLDNPGVFISKVNTVTRHIH